MQNINLEKISVALVVALFVSCASAQVAPDDVKARRIRGMEPAPYISFNEFIGVYEAEVPERIGVPTPTVTMVLNCSGTSCELSIGNATEYYRSIGSTKLGLFERTHRYIAQHFAGAQVRGCINLAGDSMPNGPFACRVDGLPSGGNPVLIVPPGRPGGEIALYPRKR